MVRGYDDALRIAARRHDIIGIHLHDERERDLPDIGLVRARDAETQQAMWLDTSNPNIRERYTQFYYDTYEYFRNTFLKSRSDIISIDTAESYVNALHRFFKSR